MAYEVIPTEPFEREYDGIVQYLVVGLRAPDAARRLLSGMEKAREVLSDNPRIRAVSRKPLLEALELREYHVCNYVVVYRIEGEKVFLLHMFHQRQDFESKL